MKKSKKLFVIAALAVLVLAGAGGYGYWNANRVASVVYLDVNPSMELHVDQDGEVLEVIALNTDAEKVLDGMKIKGADADTAVNAIIGSLLRHGYIDEIANSILLTVEDEDTVRGEKLKQELTEEINEILSATAINASILSQNMKDTQLDEQEGISEGKAALIQNIVDANETYKADELADLSVNELNLIISNSKNNVSDVQTTGSATDSAYMGKDAAKAAAFEHAAVKEADVREIEVEMDYEYGTMVYDVEFASGQYEYDYSVDAKTGEILYSHREYDDDYVVPTVKNETTTSKESTTETNKTENKNTDNSKKTTSSTSSNNKETTSSTSSNNKETTSSTSSGNKETTSADIGKEKAKAIALSNAGYSESEVTRLSVERDRDDGRIEYSVEFTADGKEYDYEIDGSSGKILDYDVEVADRD